MKKLMKKIIIVGSVVLVVLLGLIALGAILMPSDQISERLERELEKATGAEATVSGASVKYWPQLGVSLKKLTLRGNGSQLKKATGTDNKLGDYDVALDEFVVQVAVSPLFKKEILIEAIRLDGLSFNGDLKGQPLSLTGADLAVRDLEISMDGAQNAGQAASLNANQGVSVPMGELIPEELVLAFDGKAKGLLTQGLNLENIIFSGDLDHRLISVEDIKASLGTGLLQGTVEVDFERDPLGWLDFEAEAQEVEAKTLLQPWARGVANKLDTNLNTTVRGSCLLGDENVLKRTLSMTGAFSSGEGMLRAAEWLGDVRPYLGSRQDLVDVKFHSLNHQLRIDQGRYVVENLVIDGLDTHWVGQGAIGLDDTIDMKVLVKLPSGFTPDLGQWAFMAETLRDENGRVNLDLRLTGKASKPMVGFNFGSLQEAVGQDSGEALKKGLGGLLDKWKGR